jgi:hypothetical protein
MYITEVGDKHSVEGLEEALGGMASEQSNGNNIAVTLYTLIAIDT